MSLLGNIIWLIFGGFLTGLGYILGGLVLCLTIIGIPFGLQAIKLGGATMTPFGREIVEDDNPNGVLKLIFNLIWIVLFGWEIAIAHLAHAAILAITIIGLPFAKQHVKLLVIALFPFGRNFKQIH
ncbi:YccF domain-containing protein [filamentous cyanobacterium CCP5]|nr:YccF domain-containing protein [filamentous cyanobacterium CCP5]